MAGNLGSQLPDGGDRDSKKQIKSVRRKGRLLEGTGRESFRVGLRGDPVATKCLGSHRHRCWYDFGCLKTPGSTIKHMCVGPVWESEGPDQGSRLRQELGAQAGRPWFRRLYSEQVSPKAGPGGPACSRDPAGSQVISLK